MSVTDASMLTIELGGLTLPRSTPRPILELFDMVRDEMNDTWLTQQPRYADQIKIRDQLEGGAFALRSRYHQDPPGLTENQAERIRQARKHVNLVEPALDRLVNSIHAGRITRRADSDERLQEILRRDAHGAAMARLCESAFAFGTGYLVPMWVVDRVAYWTPDPIWTVLIVDPMDVYRARGIIGLIRDASDTRTIGLRFVTDTHEGSYRQKTGALEYTEHNLGMAPVVVAYGRDQRHRGRKYGKSLVLPAADGSIQITNNELNLEILRDRQTQALLKIWGEPYNTKNETRQTTQKFLQWDDKEKGDAEYITPESRIDDVIKLTERFATDVAVATGLPMDTFRPELVTGSDASATAARQRAFPLQQRMTRLMADWRMIEVEAAGVIAAQIEGATGVASWADIAQSHGVRVAIQPSIPEAEAETLSNWQQRTEKFLSRIEDAIEYYSGHLSDEEKAELARLWKIAHEPTESTAEEAEQAFKREVAKLVFQGATTREVATNLTDLRALWDEAAIKRDPQYEEPWMPVLVNGQPVSGETIEDEDGSIVGGDVLTNSKSEVTHDRGEDREMHSGRAGGNGLDRAGRGADGGAEDGGHGDPAAVDGAGDGRGGRGERPGDVDQPEAGAAAAAGAAGGGPGRREDGREGG